MNIQEQIAANRDFCKSPFAKERELSDQQKRLPQPPLCKPAQSEQRILLGRDFRSVMTQTDFFTILQKRTSQRFYRDEECHWSSSLFYCGQRRGSNRSGETIMLLCGRCLPVARAMRLKLIWRCGRWLAFPPASTIICRWSMRWSRLDL